MKKIIQFILKVLARSTITRYQPRVVGITGSVGKTSTKEAIAAILALRYSVGQTNKNFNNEIGLPLTIIGAKNSGYRNPITWLIIFVRALWQIIVKNNKYPEFLILEMGIDHKGDMDYLLSIVQPEAGVLTAVSEVHLEFLGSIDNVVYEKGKLLRSLPKQGIAVINCEDQRLLTLLDKIKAKIITFGFSNQAQVWADGIQMSKNNNNEVQGLSFKLHYGGGVTPLLLPQVLGRHQINIALAAAAIGLGLEFTAVDVSSALRNFTFPPGRMKLIPGVKNTKVIDDSYNSSPLALKEALKTLADFPLNGQAKRWAILGDMLELGADSIKLHRECGELVANLGIDYLMTVGEQSRDLGRGAGASGFGRDNYVHFATAQEAALFVKDKLCEGDVLLIKGSQGIRMERAVKELMADPTKANDLLVRQYKPWI
ncbi:MAG: Mur ligase family protein [Patescibacteria group bacterium]